jgi:hypothetical protein
VSDLITRTARLVPYAKRPKQVPSFVTAYAYEPLATESGAQYGCLYVVVEVLVSGRASEEVADLIIETIGEKYYNQHEPDTDALKRFEAAIKATNQELGEHVNRGNAAWIGKLSAVVAVQVGSELHVSQTGSAEAFLYRGKAVTHITPPSTVRPATPTKTFGSIASGQLEPGDRLLLATPALIHQIPLSRLQNVITSASPNSAIAEITKLLRGASTDRVAALVIELTTPELAALQVRTEEPSEIQLGLPETPLEAAKLVATPLAQSTVASSKKVAHIAHTGIERARPHAKALGLVLADKTRQILSTKTGRRNTLIGIGVAIAAIIIIALTRNLGANTTATFTKYQQIYADFQHGEQLLANGDKGNARIVFEDVQHQLGTLGSRTSIINQHLQHGTLPEGEPRSVGAFNALVADRLDQIEGLTKADPITIATFNAKNAKVTQFQLAGNTAYVFDTGNKNALSIINLTTGTSTLGNVVSTTISGNNDGIYILTDKPSVWFYRFDTDAIAEQTIAFGSWPKATGLASYSTNLYLLSGTSIYKHTKNATGFSPKTEYFALSSTEASRDASALAIDGAIYLLSPSGLHRYIGSVLKQSAPIPDTLSGAKDLRVAPDGSTIIAVNSSNRRIGLWNFKGEALTFEKQLAPNNTKAVSAAAYDPKTGSIYALADNRLVRIPLHP